MASDELLEESSPPGVRPRPSRSPFGIGFLSPPEEPAAAIPSPAASPEAGPATWPLPVDDGSGSGSGSTTVEPDEDSHDSTTSPASSSSSTGRLGKAAARATGAKAVLTATGIAHRVGARTEGQQLAGLYLADEDDAEAIGHPLADIVSRRSGTVGAALSPDANDALSALIGLAGYMSKQIANLVAAQQHDAAQRGPAPVAPAQDVQ